MKYPLTILSKVADGKILGDGDDQFEYVHTDSRTISNPESTLFIAKKGPQFDGHKFIPDLISRGVRLFVTEREVDLPSGCSQFVTRDSLATLQRLATFHRSNFDYPVVGITGSYAKTIVKEWSSVLLGSKYRVAKTPASHNSKLGVPLSVLEMNANHQAGVFEAGISETGEMSVLANIIKPEMGVFTNIGSAHASGFDSRLEKIREKAKLFQSCQKIICCFDHKEIYQHLTDQYPTKVLGWSLQNPKALLFLTLNENQLTFDWEGVDYQLDIPYHQGVELENLCHAVVLGALLKLSSLEMQGGIGLLPSLDMRLQMVEGINNCYLLDDTYTNDLSGLEVALQKFSEQNQHDKRSVILSDLSDLKGDDENGYLRVYNLLKSHKINRLIAVGEDLKTHLDSFEIPEILSFNSTEELRSALPPFSKEMVLIKGARKFRFERIIQDLEARQHRTQLRINFTSLIHNINAYRNLIQPNTRLMVMVKAFAYGGGSAEIANILQYNNVDYLGVAYVDEGVALRENGIRLPIMVMNTDERDLSLCQSYHLEPEVYSISYLKQILSRKINLTIHLKLETGMNRLGFTHQDLPELKQLIASNENLKVASIFSHLASAENEADSQFTEGQATRFQEMYENIVTSLPQRPLRHLVNSAGIARWPDYHFDMVRLGIGAAGLDPTSTLPLQPIGQLVTQVTQLKWVQKGESVGYNRAFKATEDTMIAVIPIGYADGFLRVFGNGQAQVMINDQLIKTVGNICMDMTMLDVTDKEVREGDQVTIFGERPTISDLANWSNTIPYEVLTNVGQRVKRVYSW